MSVFFFFNDTATTEIYTLSLHDALPIWPSRPLAARSNLAGFSSGLHRCPSSATAPTDTTSFRSEEHTSELQSQSNLVCRLLLVKKHSGTARVCAVQSAVLAVAGHVKRVS